MVFFNALTSVVLRMSGQSRLFLNPSECVGDFNSETSIDKKLCYYFDWKSKDNFPF